jgi:hypothetical protein
MIKANSGWVLLKMVEESRDDVITISNGEIQKYEVLDGGDGKIVVGAYVYLSPRVVFEVVIGCVRYYVVKEENITVFEI